MSDTREKYDREHAQTRAFFADAVEVYRNDSIIIKDARGCFRPMQRPWPKRPLDHVRGLFVHHRASWNSYEDMQKNVVIPRYDASIKAHKAWVAGGRKGKEPTRRHDRPAYTMGVDHNPETIDGLVVVYQFNDLEARSWHSGAKGKDSGRFADWRRRQGPGHSANQYTVGLNLTGYFQSRGHEPNHPDAPDGRSVNRAVKAGRAGRLICEPSIEQCRAVWGVWCYLIDEHNVLHDDVPRESVFGHVDTGKTACPGITGMELVTAIRNGAICNTRELDRWLAGRQEYILPGGYPSPSDVYLYDIEVEERIDFALECQRLLVELGYDIGSYGPLKNGVDGSWGNLSRIALIDFEERAGLLENGYPEKADFDALKAAMEAA